MKTNFLLKSCHRLNISRAAVSLVVAVAVSGQAQTTPPAIEWQNSFGGNRGEDLRSVEQTADGGYIISGDSFSDISGNKTTAGYGSRDRWIIKTDANGNKIWEQTFGGNALDYLSELQQTSDGGFVLMGYSSSGVTGNKTSTNYGAVDGWVVKTDGNGSKVWEQSYGGTSSDAMLRIHQTTDGGYLLTGYSNSGISGNKTNPTYGGFDYWVVKIDAGGNKLWDKSFGGSTNETLYTSLLTSDGSCILCGTSISGVSGNKTGPNYGGTDAWIVKIDPAGNKLWDKSFGGSANETINILKHTADGGYILGGQSESGVSGNKTSAGYGGIDFWVVKIDGNGNKVWDKSFGTTGDDYLNCLEQDGDGGYLLGGGAVVGISGNKTNAGIGLIDYWVVKIDANGNKLWERTFGRQGYDNLNGMQPTSDGGYILAGHSAFGSDYGPYDYYLVRIDSLGNKIWEKFIGGAGGDTFRGLRKTRDGGFILAGVSDSAISGDKTTPAYGFDDYWIVKLAGPAAPVFQSPTITNGVFQANVLRDANTVYRIDGSTNLTDWFELTRNTNTGAPFLFHDDAATNVAKRFYRMVLIP